MRTHQTAIPSIPEDPKECFDFAAQALDLADQLQTPVFVMSDLDIGMNTRLCAPFEWDENRHMQRGKIVTREQLDAGIKFGRYQDVDGDGIPFRTYPGTHPSKGAFFTRGTSKDANARYSERGEDYVENMRRLQRKFETAKSMVPQPVEITHDTPATVGVLYFGSTSPAMQEAMDNLQQRGLVIDAMRLRAFPFPESVMEFIHRHEKVFVVEQNRDGQLRSLLINEGQINPAKLIPVLHFDGTPITARFITKTICTALNLGHCEPLPKQAAL